MVGKDLAKYITGLSYNDFSEDVEYQAKRLILDAISSMFLGAGEKRVGDISGFLKKLEMKPECTVVGKNFKTSCIWSAFANASYAQVHDFNDGHRGSEISSISASACWGGNYHPGRLVIPTALAVGEKLSLTGEEVITAIVIGYDVATRIRGVKRKPPAEAYRTAAVAGKMMGLGEREILNALGIAGAIGPGKIAAGADADWLSYGYYAKAGIEAAMLAAEGLNGAAIYDDPVLSTRFNEKGLWKEFEIENCYIKPYPTCRATHGAIEAVLEIREETGFRYTDIEEVIIYQMTSGMYAAWSTDINSDYKNCEYNIFYPVACAIIDGEVTLRQFTNERISDPVIYEVMKKIKVIPDENLDLNYPDKNKPTVVEIKLINGNTYTKRIDLPKGDAKNPLTDEELMEKFIKCSEACITKERALEIKQAVYSLDKMESLTELTKLLSI